MASLTSHYRVITSFLSHAARQIVTISGRTIRKEAQADPERARVAIARIETLLDKLPNEELRRAKELRSARNARPVAS